MIVLQQIAIKEFRGIRELTVDLAGKSYAICGPNGTGKSGVVDAIEFGLTGAISRLAGSGRGELSLSKHAPHVDSRNSPEKAAVTLNVFIPSLGKTARIVRTVKDASAPQVTPADPDVLRVLRQVGNHPEFALSRRELIKYVLATPGERAQEVSALLHLDQVESVRASLLKIANSAERAAKQFGSASNEAKAALLRALGVGTLTRESVLTASNAQRAILGLPALTELTESTSLKDGVVSSSSTTPPRMNKANAQEELRHLRSVLAEIRETKAAAIAAGLAGLQGLEDEPLVVDSLERERFLKRGLDLVDGEVCPFCDLDWDVAKLRNLVAEKLRALEKASSKRKVVETTLAPVIELMGRLVASLGAVIPLGARTPTVLALEELRASQATLKTSQRELTDLLPLSVAVAAIEQLRGAPDRIESELVVLESSVAALPEASVQEAARDWLTVAQERLGAYREARRKEQGAFAQATSARTISNTYAVTSDRVLTGIYKAVEKDFAALYADINPDDEAAFRAELKPSMGKLGFGVDFYGRGLFPPGAYHSEGHQDGMGLCLYLALMRHLQGDEFRFAVLDDVLMSVDVGHRREVCRVLKAQFPNTQFIVTTHDRIWLRHMKTEGVIGPKAALNFRRWDVGHGPTQWEDRDVWQEIDAHLNDDKVHNAASVLRNYVEYEAAELCHALRAPVEYRGDAQYQLGDLLPAAVGQLNSLLKAGRAAAESWKQADVAAAVAKRKDDFATAVAASQVDNWQVNTAIHYNGWENLSKRDFKPVAEAMRNLLASFACSECHGLLRVVPEREAMATVRCDCNKVAINLKKKPA